MIRPFLTFAVGAAIALLLGACKSTPNENRGLSSYLFNGKNLKGWVPLHGGSWSVEESCIVGRKGTGWAIDPERSGSWLRTEKIYKDFLLELEYNINAGGNSGVFIRSAQEKNPAFTGYEIQIYDDAGRAPSKSGSGSLYSIAAPLRNTAKPAGEWNRARILAKGSKIQIHLNGVLVVDTEADRATSGYIGLQNHDDKSIVKFRNVRLTEL